MARYRLELATAEDDADLRFILQRTPMAGRISVGFRREPSYFAASAVEGDFCQVVAARDEATQQLIGFGTRSIRRRFVNGQPMPIGYLSNLRLLEDHRRGTLVARGYRFFRQLHDDGRTRLYLTTVAEENEAAKALLTSGRAGLPRYVDAGRYVTFAMPARGRLPRKQRLAEPKIDQAGRQDIPPLCQFLNDVGQGRQFFPNYSEDDFFPRQATFKDLRLDDILLARNGGRIVGVLGLWDQRRFRQSIVTGYSSSLRWCRTLVNAWARLSGGVMLPRPGGVIPYATGCLPLVEHDDGHTFRALVRAALRRLANAPCDCLLIGLHESDPLSSVLESFARWRYKTRLYFVVWEDGDALLGRLDARSTYLELGCL